MRRIRAVNKDVILTWRKKHGYTQKQLSDASGVARAAIAQIETQSTIYPTKETLDKLAKAMNLDSEKLLLSEKETLDLSKSIKANTKKQVSSGTNSTQVFLSNNTPDRKKQFYYYDRRLPMASIQAEFTVSEMMLLMNQIQSYFSQLYSEIEKDDFFDGDTPRLSQPHIVKFRELYRDKISEAEKLAENLKEIEPALRSLNEKLGQMIESQKKG